MTAVVRKNNEGVELIILTVDGGRPFVFGRTKARMLLGQLPVIERFVAGELEDEWTDNFASVSTFHGRLVLHLEDMSFGMQKARLILIHREELDKYATGYDESADKDIKSRFDQYWLGGNK